ncbi:MAG: bifunctional oligoribonuclease/PAP phosphatase NrnA [Pirellulales bacterium]
MGIDWRPFVEIVREHKSFVLTSHMRPDCDAIGSELGLALALRSLGKEARIVNGDTVPPHIAFIDPKHDVLTLGRDIQAADVRPDVLIVVDTSAWAQLGPMGDVVRNSAAKKIVIDHHVSQDNLSAIVFKDVQSEATGRLILSAIDALGASVTPQIAEPLFAAIATDTGWFRFNSVTALTFAAAGRLVHSGASPSSIFTSLYEQNTLARLHLQGRILTAAKTECDGRLIYSGATPQDLAETGAEATDTEDVVNRLLGITGVEVALLFLELGPNETKVSLRSRTAFDVRKIAEQFGGGGHTAASGVRYPGALADAVKALTGAVRAAI